MTMEINYADIVRTIVENPELKCPICGSSRYITDEGNHEIILHCSSDDARFWDFDRGSTAQVHAKEHWDQSRKEIFLGDVLY